MEQLNFGQPEYSEISWLNDTVKKVWEPRIERIVEACQEIEWLSVAKGIRRCATMSISAQHFISLGPRCLKAGLFILPLGHQVTQNYSYSKKSLAKSSVEKSMLNVVIGTSEDVLKFRHVSEVSHNIESTCDLLGYPSCCRESLRQIVEKRLKDATWPIAVTTTVSSGNNDKSIEINSIPLINIMWRWLGICAIPHLPCSFDCKSSWELAKKYIDIGRSFWYNDEMDWLLEILTWPVQWSALDGIAEIKTPILKFSAKTDITAIKYTVKCVTNISSVEKGEGLDISDCMSESDRLTQSKKTQKGLKNPSNSIKISSNHNQEVTLSDSWYYKENGFYSRPGMDMAHKPIVELAVTALSMYKRFVNVLDLGCGNGVLLKKIHKAYPQMIPWGIDDIQSKIKHAQMLLPEFKENFVVGDISNFDSLLGSIQYAVVIVALSRIEEMDPGQVTFFKKHVNEYCDNLLVCDYWGRELEFVARRVGVYLLSPKANATAGYARFATNKEASVIERRIRSQPDSVTHIKESHSDLIHTDYPDHSDFMQY